MSGSDGGWKYARNGDLPISGARGRHGLVPRPFRVQGWTLAGAGQPRISLARVARRWAAISFVVIARSSVPHDGTPPGQACPKTDIEVASRAASPRGCPATTCPICRKWQNFKLLSKERDI